MSGDGESNSGLCPHEGRPGGIGINRLVIGLGNPAETLGPYYRIYVIQGPEALVEHAADFADYEATVVRKLRRELQVLVASGR